MKYTGEVEVYGEKWKYKERSGSIRGEVKV